MLSLVKSVGGRGHSSDGDHTDPRDDISSNGPSRSTDEDGDDESPCRAALNALLGPFISHGDIPLDYALGFYLTPTEARFLVRRLVCVGSFVAKVHWGSFDAVQATEHIDRLARMNPEECLAFMNERQADIAYPRLTDQLEDFGHKHKRLPGNKPSRPFLAALFAAILTS